MDILERIHSPLLPHTINQVPAEYSELEQLLDKLCDTAFITGKGEKKPCKREVRNQVLHCCKLGRTSNTKTGLKSKRVDSFQTA